MIKVEKFGGWSLCVLVYYGILGTHGHDLCTAAGSVTFQVVTSAKCQITLWTKPLVSKHRESFLEPKPLSSMAELNCSSEYEPGFFPWNLDVFISDTVADTIQMKTCSTAIQTSDLPSSFVVRHFDYNKWLWNSLLKSKLLSLSKDEKNKSVTLCSLLWRWFDSLGETNIPVGWYESKDHVRAQKTKHISAAARHLSESLIVSNWFYNRNNLFVSCVNSFI